MVVCFAEWVCPCCRDLCNCSRHRKKRKWEATGQLHKSVKSRGEPAGPAGPAALLLGLPRHLGGLLAGVDTCLRLPASHGVDVRLERAALLEAVAGVAACSGARQCSW